ncbi:hypothetical protein AGR6A_pAt60095 [Agrobacterium sp. NCPPB 925]|nr:hypothetical protein AGR6A_pAt60095 [Agrobacterium sp. NCPPB 925]
MDVSFPHALGTAFGNKLKYVFALCDERYEPLHFIGEHLAGHIVECGGTCQVGKVIRGFPP